MKICLSAKNDRTLQIHKKAGYGMIKEMFSSMHELLDFIIEHYAAADEETKQEYCFRIQQLKETNDLFMDHWVAFEEKLALFFEQYHELQKEKTEAVAISNSNAASSLTSNVSLHNQQVQQQYNCNECDLCEPNDERLFEQAIGYYRLFMFKEANGLLASVIKETPECNRARLFYAMSLMHLQQWSEAQRQFQLITVLSDFPKWQALSLNALGCIQAIHCHMVEAEHLFRKAYHIYPQFEDSYKNLLCCTENSHELFLYFGSTELISM